LLSTPMALSSIAIGSLGAIAVARASSQALRRGAFCVAGLGAASVPVYLVAAWQMNKTDPLVQLYTGAVVPGLTTAAMIIAVNFPAGLVARSLSARWLVWLGIHSYGWYVYHNLLAPLTRTMDLSAWPGGGKMGAICYLVLYLGLSLAMAVISYRWFERPFLDLKRPAAGPPAQEGDATAGR
jgi:peptidoglycan/LPS O-acetylase OafA/YrhL